tara:strand:+ start:502 stop:3108 length:2607 start_codon:yes stop_codon:yes gene_type:complete
MSNEYLVECSRAKSKNSNDINNNNWSNIVSNGLVLNQGDQVELNSAYLHSIGVAEPDSIFLSGRKSGTKIYNNKYNIETKQFDKTLSFEQFDNSFTLLNSYYTSHDSSFNFINPPTYFNDSNASYRIVGDTVIDPDADPDSIITPIQTSDFWSLDPPTFESNNILEIYRQTFKNERFTVLKRDLTVNEDTNIFSEMVYYDFETETNISLPQGYNNKSFVASELTRQLNVVNNEYTIFKNPVKKESEALGFRSPALATDYLPLKTGQDNLASTFVKETPSLKAIDCGNEQTYSRQAYSTFRLDTDRDLYTINFNYIGVKYYNTFMEFRKFMYHPKKQIDGKWDATWGQVQTFGGIFNLTLLIDAVSKPVDNSIIEISMFYNEENNKALYDVFQAQLKDYNVLTDINYNPLNERFLHIEGSETASYSYFGSDFYFNHLTHLLKIHLVEDIYGQRGNGTLESPDYGFIYKGSEAAPNSGIYFTKLKMNIPEAPLIKYPLTSNVRKIGVSRSATSHGNQSCTFWNGYNTVESTAFKSILKINYKAVDYYTSPTITKCYIGADQLLINYNETENRFEVKQCHNMYKAGNDLRAIDEAENINQNPNAGLPILKINPLSTNQTFNPQTAPTDSATEFLVIDQTTPGAVRPFFSLERYTIFDSYSGLFWDFTTDESFFNKSIWSILGFTPDIVFDQTPNTSTRQVRNSYTKNSYPLTTNANINSEDIMAYSVNPQGFSTYIGQLPVIQYQTTTNPTNRPPNIIQQVLSQNSTSISAQKLAIQNNEGVYLIRSNIIPNKNYLDGQVMDIVGVVGKSALSKDFIYSFSNDLIFTITKTTIINSININITNADGSDAILNENSLIIFKVVKNKPQPIKK